MHLRWGANLSHGLVEGLAEHCHPDKCCLRFGLQTHVCMPFLVQWLMPESQSATCRIRFSPSTTWRPRIGFRFSGLVGQAPFPAELSHPSWSPSFKTPSTPCQRPFLVLINYQLLILFSCVSALALPSNSNSWGMEIIDILFTRRRLGWRTCNCFETCLHGKKKKEKKRNQVINISNGWKVHSSPNLRKKKNHSGSIAQSR